MTDADPPDIPEPEFTSPLAGTHSIPAPFQSARPGPHIPDPPPLDPSDPNLPANIDFANAWELVAKAKHVRHLTLRNSMDPAWREMRERIVDLRAMILPYKDSKSQRLLHDVDLLLEIHK